MEDYTFATHIYYKTNCRNIGEYSKLYLETDVLILADVTGNFINNSIEAYDLDPTDYFPLPSYSWDAILKYTDVKKDEYGTRRLRCPIKQPYTASDLGLVPDGKFVFATV